MRSSFLLLLSVLFAGRTLLAQNSDPFSPMVTRAESELIQKAVTAETFEQGAGLLEESRSEKSSAAIDFSYGNLLSQSEKYVEAVAAYETALRKFPNFRDAKINLGRVYLLLEKPGESVRVYQELVRDGIADGETYKLLGHGLMLQNRSVSAETAYRQALLLDENGTEAREGLLNCLLDQQRNEEVLALTGELLQEDFSRKAYWAARANAQLSLGKTEAAARSLEQCRRLGLADAQMTAMLGQLYLEEAPGEAVARFMEAFESGELPIRNRVQAVKGMLQLGRMQEAEQLLEMMETQIKSLPEEEREGAEGLVLKLKVRLYMVQGLFQEAEELLRKGLVEAPMDGELLLHQAGMLREQEKTEEAVLVLERLTRLPGFEAEALIQLAQIEVGREQWASALTLLERAHVFEEKPQLQAYILQLRRMASAGGGE